MINEIDDILRESESISKEKDNQKESKETKHLRNLALKVTALESTMKNLSDASLKESTNVFRLELANNPSLIYDEEFVIKATALVREAVYRNTGKRLFETQVMAGIGAHFGYITEMRTGEGKTLSITIPAYLNAISGKGVHIGTANQYLAERDMEEVKTTYESLGLSIGIICDGGHRNSKEFLLKKEAYASDITYGTARAFAFDHLRDTRVKNKNERVQRGHNFALIDEVDSILIDEARTPLIHAEVVKLSDREQNEMARWIRWADSFVRKLHIKDYELNIQEESVKLADSGLIKLDLGYKSFRNDEMDYHEVMSYVIPALKAHLLFKEKERYIVKDNEIKIVDESTGRLSNGKKYQDGLHNALEVKHGVPITDETVSSAKITYQKYFSMYKNFAGMTGTAKTSKKEFEEIYGKSVVEIPPNKSLQVISERDRLFFTEEEKIAGIINDVIKRHQTGQPILLGTSSIENSMKLYKAINAIGIECKVLNAENEKEEAEIIAGAGKKGSVIVATNMAGRGTDIKLGGSEEFELKRQMRLRNYTEEEISTIVSNVKLIDPKLIEAKRIYEALKIKVDALVDKRRKEVRNLGELRNIMHKKGFNDEIINLISSDKKLTDSALIAVREYYNKLIDIVDEKMHERRNENANKNNVNSEYDGLAVLGTERYASRRIDNQLKGRTGRQGDPGYSVFYVSYNDKLFQKYGDEDTEKKFSVQKGLGEVTGLINVALNKALESTQAKSEEKRAEGRKFTICIDNIDSIQRDHFLGIRDKLVDSENTSELVQKLASEYIGDLMHKMTPVDEKINNDKLNEILDIVNGKILFRNQISIDEIQGKKVSEIKDYISKKVRLEYDRNRDSEIGKKNIEKERDYAFKVMDSNWTTHQKNTSFMYESLSSMSDMPGAEDSKEFYRRESLKIYGEMIRKVEEGILFTLMKSNFTNADEGKRR